MIVVPISRGLFTSVDDCDFLLMQSRLWRASGTHAKPYVVSGDPKRSEQVYLHRLIMGAPPGLVVDHLDDNGLNNQRHNLRLCTHRENIARCNTANKPSATRLRGVFPNTGCATFTARLGRHYLGSFRSVEDAARAYDQAAKAEYGRFANLNFPDPALAGCATPGGAEQPAY